MSYKDFMNEFLGGCTLKDVENTKNFLLKFSKNELSDILKWLLRNNYSNIVKIILLECGFGFYDGVILQTSSREGYTDIVKMCLEHGVDPNSQNALYFACFYGHEEVVSLLLSYGADPNNHGVIFNACNDVNGGSVLYMGIVKLLLKYGADPFSIEDESRKITTLSFLIKNNLISSENIEKNKEKIPSEVWTKCYA